MERNAFNGKFSQADFSNQVLDSCNVSLANNGDQCKQLCTLLNVDGIVQEIDTDTTVIQCSDNPGEYVFSHYELTSANGL